MTATDALERHSPELQRVIRTEVAQKLHDVAGRHDRRFMIYTGGGIHFGQTHADRESMRWLALIYEANEPGSPDPVYGRIIRALAAQGARCIAISAWLPIPAFYAAIETLFGEGAEGVVIITTSPLAKDAWADLVRSNTAIPLVTEPDEQWGRA